MPYLASRSRQELSPRRLLPDASLWTLDWRRQPFRLALLKMSDRVRVTFPQKLAFLFRPARYKVLYGGRGGAKSWGIARALLLKGSQKPLRILCTRELQESIADSVHELLKSQAKDIGLEGFYEVQKTTIIGKNGSQFVYDGLRHNLNSLKSFEGADIVWVEEANNVSKLSWDVLIPTIRKEKSEIWMSFNPELATDETYKRFVLNPPSTAKVVKISWRDNPWFPEVLRKEMEDLKERDYDAYLNVWEGNPRVTLDGAIYAKELRKVLDEGRRTKVRYDPSRPVFTFWDLGRSDKTCIWFAQLWPMEKRIIDYYENRGYAIDHYIKVVQDKKYTYADHYLPHDAKHKTILHPLSVEGQLKARGWSVKIVPNIGVKEGINAARLMFPTCVFDEENTSDGWHALSHYQYEVDQATGTWSKNPLHNDASHGADAFRMMAVGLRDGNPKVGSRLGSSKVLTPKKVTITMPTRSASGGWMR